MLGRQKSAATSLNRPGTKVCASATAAQPSGVFAGRSRWGNRRGVAPASCCCCCSLLDGQFAYSPSISLSSSGGRPGGRAPDLVPTASHAPAVSSSHALPSTAAIASPSPATTAPVDASFAAPTTSPVSLGPNPRIVSSSRQPQYPGASSPIPTPEPPPGIVSSSSANRTHEAAASPPSAARPSRRRPPTALQDPLQSPFRVPQPPFRSRASNNFLQRPLRRLSSPRLWNPTNSTPRPVGPSSRRTHQLQPQLQPRPHQPSAAVAPTVSRTPARRRAPSTPPPPAVPLSHPTLDDIHTVADDPIGTGAGDYPLLTLPEQRQIRHSTSTRASLQVERAGSEKRVSLPKSLRHSYDGKRLTATSTPPLPDSDAETAAEQPVGAPPTVAGPSAPAPAPAPTQPRVTGLRKRGQSISNAQQEGVELSTLQSRPTTSGGPGKPFGLSFSRTRSRSLKQDKGKGKMAATEHDDAGEPGRSYSKDLERGPDVLGNHSNTEDPTNRLSTTSMPDGLGIGSAISSSNSSIMGDPEAQPDAGDEWGPQHPCFPHRNPHVPVDTPAYATTRIIRIRRDWLIAGDLAPTFSNLYPEILDPAGLSEPEFRRVIDKLNRELTQTFQPWSVRNVVDGILSLATGWLWEDLGFTGAKSRLAKLERWIERWNDAMAAAIGGAADRTGSQGGADDGPIPPKIIPLRETGYMTLDIQIGDPEIAPAPSTRGASRAGLSMEGPA